MPPRPKSDLAAALKRRQLTQRNLKRYLHTRSFNRLAGRNTAPGSLRPETRTGLCRFFFCLGAAAFFLVGLYCALV